MNYHTGANAYPVGEAEHEPGPEIGARQVAHDMESIFGSTTPVPNRIASSDPIVPLVAHSSDDRARRHGSRRSLGLTGTVIAGALVASTVLALHVFPNRSPRQITIPLPPIASQVAQVDRVPTPVEPQIVAAARPTKASRHAAGKLAVVELRPGPSPATRHPKHELPRRHTTSVPRPHKSTPRFAAKSATAVPPPHASGSCDRLYGLDLARCMRPQVLDADQQLRDAYQDAIQAGVDRRVLASYRRQWSKLRKRANSDPHSVTTGYRQMAEQLDAARTGRLAGNM
jgi:hypothetical protein